MSALTHCTGDQIPTLCNGTSSRRLWKSADEQPGRAEGQWKARKQKRKWTEMGNLQFSHCDSKVGGKPISVGPCKSQVEV